MRNRNVFRDPRIVTKGNASSIEKKCQTMKWGLREKISPSHFPQKRSRTNRETHWSDHEKNYSLGGSACERLFRRESIGGEKNSALCFAEKRFIRKEAEKNGLLINNKKGKLCWCLLGEAKKWRIRVDGTKMKSKRAVITQKSDSKSLCWCSRKMFSQSIPSGSRCWLCVNKSSTFHTLAKRKWKLN